MYQKMKSRNCVHIIYDYHSTCKAAFERLEGKISVKNRKTRKKEEKIPFLKEHNGMNGEYLSQELESAILQ